MWLGVIDLTSLHLAVSPAGGCCRGCAVVWGTSKNLIAIPSAYWDIATVRFFEKTLSFFLIVSHFVMGQSCYLFDGRVPVPLIYLRLVCSSRGIDVNRLSKWTSWFCAFSNITKRIYHPGWFTAALLEGYSDELHTGEPGKGTRHVHKTPNSCNQIELVYCVWIFSWIFYMNIHQCLGNARRYQTSMRGRSLDHLSLGSNWLLPQTCRSDLISWNLHLDIMRATKGQFTSSLSVQYHAYCGANVVATYNEDGKKVQQISRTKFEWQIVL